MPTFTHAWQAHTLAARKHTNMWDGIGLALCCIQIAFALGKARGGAANYYERDVYAMTRRTHASYALASALFAVLFVLGYFSTAVPTIPLLAAYALVFIFYFSSFARGFSDEE